MMVGAEVVQFLGLVERKEPYISRVRSVRTSSTELISAYQIARNYVPDLQSGPNLFITLSVTLKFNDYQ